MRRSGLSMILTLAVILPPVVAARSSIHAAQGAPSYVVVIQNFSYQPQVLTVPAGSSVTWTNVDNAPHTPTSDKNLWTSPLLPAITAGTPPASYSHTFDTPGTFPYYCVVHPENMHGSIVVVAGNEATLSAATPPPTPAATSAAGPTATVPAITAPRGPAPRTLLLSAGKVLHAGRATTVRVHVSYQGAQGSCIIGSEESDGG